MVLDIVIFQIRPTKWILFIFVGRVMILLSKNKHTSICILTKFVDAKNLFAYRIHLVELPEVI